MPERMEVVLLRSRRRTLSLEMGRDGTLTVHAPMRCPKGTIEAFLEEKKDWIARTRARILTKAAMYPPLKLQDGEKLPFAGRELTLVFRPGVRRISRQGEKLLLPEHTDPEHLLSWLTAQARGYFAARLDYYAQEMHLIYKSLRVTSAKTRWGSCSADNRINLTRYLILCTPEAIDYVVVHELSHIRHKDHSPDFWRHVERYYPDYRTQKKWLQDHSGILELI